MQVCHVESAVFDDPNLVSCAGLGPVVALAEQCGLPQLVAAQLTLPAKAGVNAHLKVPALVGAMVAGADSIADTDLLRHGGMDRLFGEVRAPSRSRSVSAIESAPATIAPTNAGTFRCAFTPAVAGSVSCAATSCGSPHCSASATTGPSPAQDTKFGSSNTADSTWQTCIPRVPFCPVGCDYR